jgi:hypothetical protein
VQQAPLASPLWASQSPFPKRQLPVADERPAFLGVIFNEVKRRPTYMVKGYSGFTKFA